MYKKLLQTTMDSGNEMIVSLKNVACDTFQGRILDVSDDCFSMFHSGPEGGILWLFKIEDIHHCGLVVDLPTALSSLKGSKGQSTRHYSSELPSADKNRLQEREE